MAIQLPQGAKMILDRLHANQYEAYVVGGCVRDSLLGKIPSDWDICTNARPDEVKACFRDHSVIDTGIKHGTVSIVCDDDIYEVTTYRSDGDYTDHRRPVSVTFVPDLESDLERRDFTMNAMAYNDEEGIIDLHGGQEDIRLGVVRCVGDADERFQEDALRILRALRFASVYNFTVASATRRAIYRNTELLHFVSSERIMSELKKLLVGQNASFVIRNNRPVFTLLFPELGKCINFKQNNMYHTYDVYDHIAHSVGAYKGKDPTVALALLLHDIGKPACYTEEDGVGHFIGHAQISYEMAKTVLTRIRTDNRLRDNVLELVLYHDARIQPSRRAVRKWLCKLGEKQFRRLLDMQRADILAHSEYHMQKHLDNCSDVETVLEEVLSEQDCFTLKDMAINGKDLIKLGIPEGKKIGEILDRLLDGVMEDMIPNEHDALLSSAQNIWKEMQTDANS